MIAAGWELAAHTIHHLDLTNSSREAEEEVAGSRKILRREYGVPVEQLLLPGRAVRRDRRRSRRSRRLHRRDHRDPRLREQREPYELARFEILGSHVAGLAEGLRRTSAAPRKRR